MKKLLKHTLQAPLKPFSIPEQSEWLAGEGAGSWFFIEAREENFLISRYSPEGKLECEGVFKSVTDKNFNLLQAFNFTHLSHCRMVSIAQSGIIFKFERIS